MAMTQPPGHINDLGEVVDGPAPLMPGLSKESVTFVMAGHTDSGRRIFEAMWSGIKLGTYSVGKDDSGKVSWRRMKKGASDNE